MFYCVNNILFFCILLFDFQIVIDHGRAKGVEFQKDGKLYAVVAHREIILSAGAISSPKLLKLSGVGPEQELKRFNVSADTKIYRKQSV